MTASRAWVIVALALAVTAFLACARSQTVTPQADSPTDEPEWPASVWRSPDSLNADYLTGRCKSWQIAIGNERRRVDDARLWWSETNHPLLEECLPGTRWLMVAWGSGGFGAPPHYILTLDSIGLRIGRRVADIHAPEQLDSASVAQYARLMVLLALLERSAERQRNRPSMPVLGMTDLTQYIEHAHSASVLYGTMDPTVAMDLLLADSGDTLPRPKRGDTVDYATAIPPLSFSRIALEPDDSSLPGTADSCIRIACTIGQASRRFKLSRDSTGVWSLHEGGQLVFHSRKPSNWGRCWP